jgi:hypothetical protein
MLVVLDYAFFVFHTLWILFNMFGWMWRKTRRAHLIVLSLTLFAWFGLGIWYGWGYCPCTDWHFQVRRQLGYPVTETSYIQLLFRQGCGLTLGRSVADTLALGVLILIVIATAIVWSRTWWAVRRRSG